jgi:hypothetical protein
MGPKSASSGTESVWSTKKAMLQCGERTYQINIPFMWKMRADKNWGMPAIIWSRIFSLPVHNIKI